MKLLRVEPYGLRSLLLITTDGIVTAVLAEHGGTTVPDDEVEPLRGDIVAALNHRDAAFVSPLKRADGALRGT